MRQQDIEKFIKDFELQQSKQNPSNNTVPHNEKKSHPCSLSSWFSHKHYNDSVKELADKIPSLGKLRKESDLIIIDNFLPENVANALQMYLKVLPESNWQLSTSDTDAKMHDYSQGSGSTKHSFAASEGVVINSSELQKVYKNTEATVMEKFLSILASSLQTAKTRNSTAAGDRQLNQKSNQLFYTFQCGRYTSGHFIEPHDDTAYEVFDTQNYHRDIAVVLHLSKSWDFEDGGLFLDLSVIPPHPVVPRFNTLVMFQVPRLHQVTPIENHCKRIRYSVFGWVLTAPAGASSSSAVTSGSGSSASGGTGGGGTNKRNSSSFNKVDINAAVTKKIHHDDVTAAPEPVPLPTDTSTAVTGVDTPATAATDTTETTSTTTGQKKKKNKNKRQWRR